jgi:transposase
MVQDLSAGYEPRRAVGAAFLRSGTIKTQYGWCFMLEKALIPGGQQKKVRQTNFPGFGIAIREGIDAGTSGALFSYVDIEAGIAAKHPLRAMRRLTNAALADLDGAFSVPYQAIGRPSIPPERLLRATLLELLYTIRLERQLIERIEFDLLFSLVCRAFDRRVGFRRLDSKNRDRCSPRRSRKGFRLRFSALRK